MAEIKVAIKGDDEDIKRKFRDVGREANVFGEHVKEQLDKVKDGAADVAGEAGFGLVKKALTGLGTVAFAAAIVDGFKEAALAAIEFEKKITTLKFALGPAQGGLAPDLAKWVESVSGAMGDADENMEVFSKLLKANDQDIGASQRQLIDLQNAATKMGVSVRDLGEAFADMKLEGEIRPRFFREFPEIAKQVRELLGAPAPGPGTTSEQAEESLNARVKAAGGVDWLFKAVLPQIAPGGMQSSVRQEMEKTAAGQLADINEEFKELYVTLGTELLPTIKEWAGDLKAALPALEETFKNLGKDINDIMQALHKNLGWFFEDVVHDRYPGQRTIESTSNKLFGEHGNVFTSIAGLMHDAAEHLQKNAEINTATAERLGRAVNPY